MALGSCNYDINGEFGGCNLGVAPHSCYTSLGDVCTAADTLVKICPLQYGGTGQGCQPPNLITTLINIALKPGTHCTILHSNVLYLLYFTVQYYAILHCTLLHNTNLDCTVLYCTILYCTVLYNTILHCTVHVLPCTFTRIRTHVYVALSNLVSLSLLNFHLYSHIHIMPFTIFTPI